MEPHTDEPLNNDTRVRNREGSLGRKGVYRSGVDTAALSVVMLLSGCLSFAFLDERPIDELTTGETIITLRLGNAGVSVTLPDGTGDNWIVLLDFQGWRQARHVERGERGDVARTEFRVSYSVQAEDFLTTQKGT